MQWFVRNAIMFLIKELICVSSMITGLKKPCLYMNLARQLWIQYTGLFFFSFSFEKTEI